MGEVGFYLKKTEKGKKALIYLQFRYQGNKLVYSFGQSVDSKNWNPKKHRVKSNNETTADGKYSLNDLLDNLQKECLKAYNAEIKNGIPEPATLKQYLINFYESNSAEQDNKHADDDKPTLFKLIERFISGEIKNRGNDKAIGTLKHYRSTMNHLLTFSKTKNKQGQPNTVDFDTINLDFYYRFTEYLRSEKWMPNKEGKLVKHAGLKPNSVGKNIKTLKTFMSEAVDLGYTTNMQFRHKKFVVTREDTEAVYLDENEITQLYTLDLSHNKRLEQVRDLFVFGCDVGLRFSDYSNVKPQNIIEVDKELYIHMITQKTKERVFIPCNDRVAELFKKYDSNNNKLPRAPSNQKFNDYIKEVAEQAGLIQKGRITLNPDLPLYECISSHTARRSFATNRYLEGFPVQDLMKITGHKTEAAFLKYIKVSKLDTAKRLSRHYKLKAIEKAKILYVA